MKQAHQIKTADQAEAQAIAKDQIWGGEGYTVYVFDDNSFVVFSGPTSLAVDADDREQVQAYIKFLGEDAGQDQQRIDDMLAALEA